MWCKSSSILISFIAVAVAVAVSGRFCLAACPSADLNGDCFVDFNDFAMIASDWPATDFNDVARMASQWLTTDPHIPDDMARIPGGTFDMGDNFNEGNSDELPVHTVTVDSFFMGKYEITNRQYCDYLNSSRGLSIFVGDGVVCGNGNGQEYCDTSSSNSASQIAFYEGFFFVRTKRGRNMANDPMVQVSWYGAAAYCNWRSQQEGKEPCYDLSTWDCDFSKDGYRLATEAEWEYAARAGHSGRRFPWGDTTSHTQSNYRSDVSYHYDISPTRGYHPDWDDGSPYTCPGGSFAANDYGLYEVAGNVWEWCNDWSDPDYYNYSPTENPRGAITSSYRVIRGGCWLFTAYNCRVANRDDVWPKHRDRDVGFRLVQGIP